MTTGSWTVGAESSPHLEVKSWTGTNGKYEMAGSPPRKRDKWNSFTLNYRLQDQTKTNGGFYTAAGNVSTYAQPRTNALALSAQAKLVDAINASAPNLLVDVATGRQTLEMTLGAIQSFGRAALALKHGKPGMAARYLGVKKNHASRLNHKDIAGRWLELQYGWLPTLSDIHDAWRLWEAKQDNDGRILRFRSRVTETFTLDSSASPSLYSVKGPCKARYQIQAELTEPNSTARALGLLDPLSLVWEIIPWSFVVDWFIPIGTYLEVLNTVPKLSGRFLTTKSYKHIGHRTGKSPPYMGGAMTSYTVRVERTVTTGLKVGNPQFRIDKAFSPRRFWNALALAAQSFT